MNANYVGITERGDAAIDLEWKEWVLQGKPAILLTKDPYKLYEVLKLMKNELFSPNVIVHCTITGMGGSFFEPNVPVPEKSLEAYKLLIDLLGVDRVVLRIDPILVTPEGEDCAKNLIKCKIGRVRISFLDLYPHVKARLEKVCIAFDYDFHAPLEERKRIWEELGKPEVCGEPEIPCTGCVSAKDCETFGIEANFEEKGQRLFCSCLANKKELLNRKHPCPHGCVYCYWKD